MMRSWVYLGLILASLTAAHSKTPYTATLLSNYSEQLDLTLAGDTHESTRDLFNTRLAVGLEYDLPGTWLPAGTVAQTELGVGVVFELGQWPVHLRQRALWRTALWVFHFEAGLDAGLTLNPSAWAFSYGSFGVPLGLRWGWFGVQWRPAFLVGLGAEESSVFSGKRSHSIHTGLAPMSVAMQFHITALEW